MPGPRPDQEYYLEILGFPSYWWSRRGAGAQGGQGEGEEATGHWGGVQVHGLDSPAHQGGLKAGDVFVKVGGVEDLATS